MGTAIERRKRLLEILCDRRSALAENLSVELGVTVRTIYRDIEILALSYPVYTIQGIGGGVYIMDGFRLGMKYLTDTQCALLERLLKILEGEEREVLYTIIKTFRKPVCNK